MLDNPKKGFTEEELVRFFLQAKSIFLDRVLCGSCEAVSYASIHGGSD